MARERVYIETYGCQMNVSDSEVAASILLRAGYEVVPRAEEADIVLLNTCAVRENAEVRVLGRLAHFRSQPRPYLIGVLGCMAERLREQLLRPSVGAHVVVGPDSYRRLPELLNQARCQGQGIDIHLDHQETYADIIPRRDPNQQISAFTPIMRGCDNMCTYCVVPFTRGRERSRDPETIVREVRALEAQGYREVTLLGQNVDSYRHHGAHGETSFPTLLEEVAQAAPSMRIRFATSHPKDLTDEVLYTMAMYENICQHIHLPVQSGSSQMLARMRRGYSREHILERVARIRHILPECSLSTDLIAGFCGETPAEHAETLSLMEAIRFDSAFMFMYSSRPGTYAARRLEDDVPAEEKNHRLQEIITLQSAHSLERNAVQIGRTYEVLVEGPSRRSPDDHCGRTEQNKMVVFPRRSSQAGEYVEVLITDCTSSTLRGEIVGHAKQREGTI